MKLLINKPLTVMVCLMFAGISIGVGGFASGIDYEAHEGGIVGGIIGAFVGILVATTIGPIIFNDTAELERDTAGDLDASEETIVGTWTLFVVLGVMMAVIGLFM